eukprot:1023058-Prymnesium_polylepis.1
MAAAAAAAAASSVLLERCSASRLRAASASSRSCCSRSSKSIDSDALRLVRSRPSAPRICTCPFDRRAFSTASRAASRSASLRAASAP